VLYILCSYNILVWLTHTCFYTNFILGFIVCLVGWFLCVCVVLGFELRAYTSSHFTSPVFVMGFFAIGSHELFAWAGFKP
jgi:ascorbate-specific PTS system EIIC-type component UlaA